MKNIKGRMLRKLKTISKSPSWRNPTIVLEANDLVSAFQFQHKNHSLPQSGQNPSDDAVKEHLPCHANMKADGDEEDKSITSNSIEQPCSKLEEAAADPKCKEASSECPPGGKDGVVLYSTSLRGIRKTFEDCNAIRFLLGSFRVVYSERDVSMHLEYREELWRILGGRVVPPRLFIRGRCIGGADEVVGLHEKGMLLALLQGIPLSPSSCPCRGCAGMGFLLCCVCNGSRRVMDNGAWTSCPDCNENGLIKCPLCSCS